MTRSKPWQETDENASAIWTVEAGRTMCYCTTREELDERYRVLDFLVHTVRLEGHLTQRQLRCRRSREATLGSSDEIAVAIGRHGEVMFRDGAHRFAIAKVLELPRIPVQVATRHSGWQGSRREIERYAEGHSSRVPQPLLHVDQDNIPSLCRCETRCRRVDKSLAPPSAVLDLAPGWGYSCHWLEARGSGCTAITPTGDVARFLTKLRRASNRQFPIAPKDMLVGLQDAERTFGAGLVLSDGLDSSSRPLPAELLDLLARFRLHKLFVEPDAFARRSTAQGDETLTSERLLAEIAATTGLGRRICLGWSAEAGSLYRLH